MVSLVSVLAFRFRPRNKFRGSRIWILRPADGIDTARGIQEGNTKQSHSHPARSRHTAYPRRQIWNALRFEPLKLHTSRNCLASRSRIPFVPSHTPVCTGEG